MICKKFARHQTLQFTTFHKMRHWDDWDANVSEPRIPIIPRGAKFIDNSRRASQEEGQVLLFLGWPRPALLFCFHFVFASGGPRGPSPAKQSKIEPETKQKSLFANLLLAWADLGLLFCFVSTVFLLCLAALGLPGLTRACFFALFLPCFCFALLVWVCLG